MAFYLVNYDLVEEKNYIRLSKGIMSTALKYKKVLLSTWVIESNRSATNLTEALMQHIDDDDKIFVSEININSMAWVNIDDEESQWLLSL